MFDNTGKVVEYFMLDTYRFDRKNDQAYRQKRLEFEIEAKKQGLIEHYKTRQEADDALSKFKPLADSIGVMIWVTSWSPA